MHDTCKRAIEHCIQKGTCKNCWFKAWWELANFFGGEDARNNLEGLQGGGGAGRPSQGNDKLPPVSPDPDDYNSQGVEA